MSLEAHWTAYHLVVLKPYLFSRLYKVMQMQVVVCYNSRRHALLTQNATTEFFATEMKYPALRFYLENSIR